jgi:uncharacterized protein (TIGR02145 family)
MKINRTVVPNDVYGFSTLPGGYGNECDYFYNRSYYGGWWSTAENGIDEAWSLYTFHSYEFVYINNDLKATLLSIRCVQN